MSFWSERKLSTICRFVQGKAHEPFIEDDGEYICVTARFVSTNGKKYRRCTKNLTPGKVNDIAMVMSDLPNGRALARAFLVDQEDLYAINQRVCAITVVEGDPRFYFYQLNRNFQLLRYNDGINQTHLPNRAFTKLVLKVPPIEVQNQIADFLDRESARIDSLIEKKQRLVELLGEKAKHDLSSTFERLAVEYKSWRLKHVLRAGLAYGANEPSDGDDPDDVRYIRITDIDADGNLREDTFKSLPRERICDYILEEADILFARSGATVGKSFLYRKHMGECCYAGYLIRARVNMKLITPDFLKHFTSTNQYWNHILGTNIQATIQNVSAEKYANLALPLPPLCVQEQISDKVRGDQKRYASTKRNVNASIDCLKEYRSALITSAVTGQIDVTTYARSGTTNRQLDAIQSEMQA